MGCAVINPQPANRPLLTSGHPPLECFRGSTCHRHWFILSSKYIFFYINISSSSVYSVIKEVIKIDLFWHQYITIVVLFCHQRSLQNASILTSVHARLDWNVLSLGGGTLIIMSGFIHHHHQCSESGISSALHGWNVCFLFGFICDIICKIKKDPWIHAVVRIKNYFKTITNLYLYIHSCLPDIFGKKSCQNFSK